MLSAIMFKRKARKRYMITGVKAAGWFLLKNKTPNGISNAHTSERSNTIFSCMNIKQKSKIKMQKIISKHTWVLLIGNIHIIFLRQKLIAIKTKTCNSHVC